jgi:acetolactate synthase small subunit
MKEGLDIKSISQLYTETHTTSHVRTRLKGDESVNNAINCTLERESSWTTKKSTTVECEATFRHAVHLNTAQDEIPQYTGEQAAKLQHNFNNSVKNTAKTHIEMAHTEKTQNKVKSLEVQGVNLALAAAEKSDLIWKSYLYDL